MTDVLIKKSEVQETVKQKLRDIQSIEETYSKKGCDPFTAVMGLARYRSREKKQLNPYFTSKFGPTFSSIFKRVTTIN